MSAAQGRPKQARTPLGGSDVRAATSVGASVPAAQGRPKQARTPGSDVRAATSVGVLS